MIDRDKVINLLENCVEENDCVNCNYKDYTLCKHFLMADALALLKEQESVVRCKDCKHWEQSNGHCPFNSIFTNEDWFCADGVKRDE